MLRVLHRTGVILLAGPPHAFRGILNLRKQPLPLGTPYEAICLTRFSVPLRPECHHSQPQVVIDGDGDFLLGAEVAFGRLDGGVAEQELDLFEVSAVLAAEFRAGATQIVGPETLDTDGFRRLLGQPHLQLAKKQRSANGS